MSEQTQDLHESRVEAIRKIEKICSNAISKSANSEIRIILFSINYKRDLNETCNEILQILKDKNYELAGNPIDYSLLSMLFDKETLFNSHGIIVGRHSETIQISESHSILSLFDFKGVLNINCEKIDIRTYGKCSFIIDRQSSLLNKKEYNDTFQQFFR